MPTMDEKVNHLADSAVKMIEKQKANGRAPILMVFSDPRDPQHCHAIAAENLDAQEIIKWLSESQFGRIQ